MKVRSNNINAKTTDKVQQAVADVLTQFMFCNTDEERIETFKRIEDEYGIETDPYTLCPCTTKEYLKNNLQYQKDIMIEKYGHCDGLE